MGSYIRLAGNNGKICRRQAMRKTSVAPTKFTSIPILEVIDAVLAVKVSVQLRMKSTIHPVVYENVCTNNQVLLGN